MFNTTSKKLQARFDPQAAQGNEAKFFQFSFTPDAGSHYLDIQDGHLGSSMNCEA